VLGTGKQHTFTKKCNFFKAVGTMTENTINLDPSSHLAIDNSGIILEIEILLYLLGWVEASQSVSGPRWILLNPTEVKKVMADSILSTDGPEELKSISDDARNARNPWLAFRQYLSTPSLNHILTTLRYKYAQNQRDQVC